MREYNVYEDMASRAGGGIYVGVVGPVRTGKSTFIKRFMERLVIPNAAEGSKKVMTDELPQSAAGRTVMTTEPKFVPDEAAEIALKEGVTAKVRLVDCVGFAVAGANGFEEDGKPRLVKTPWSKDALPFEKAAELGTEKVIRDHSTIAILVTTDGSVTDLPREAYERAEERTVKEIKNQKKPFVIVLNCKDPGNENAVKIARAAEKKYGAPTIALNAEEMTEEDIRGVFRKALLEFPVTRIDINLPEWVRSLPEENEVISSLESKLKKAAAKTNKMQDCFSLENLFGKDDDFYNPDGVSMDLGKGVAEISLKAKEDLYFRVVSEECGEEIGNDYDLLAYVKSLAEAKKNYDKIKAAMEEADECGYGAVPPSKDEMRLSEPKLVKKGSGYGVAFHAVAPSYHVLKVDVTGEAAPIIGSKEQGEDFAKERLAEYESDESKVWETNIFGRTLKDIVAEDMARKPYAMPAEVRKKMRRAVGRIVNEGKGGVICILL